MRNKPIQADQLIPTSSTPPPEAGFYRIDRHTIGVVGNMSFRDPNTQVMTSAVTANTDPVTGGSEIPSLAKAGYLPASRSGKTVVAVIGDSITNGGATDATTFKYTQTANGFVRNEKWGTAIVVGSTAALNPKSLPFIEIATPTYTVGNSDSIVIEWDGIKSVRVNIAGEGFGSAVDVTDGGWYTAFSAGGVKGLHFTSRWDYRPDTAVSVTVAAPATVGAIAHSGALGNWAMTALASLGLSDVDVLPFGIPSDKLNPIMRRTLKQVIPLKPDIALIHASINSYVTADIADLIAMIRAFTEAGTIVVVSTIIPLGGATASDMNKLAALNNKILNIRKFYPDINCLIFDAFSRFVNPTALSGDSVINLADFTSDKIHPVFAGFVNRTATPLALLLSRIIPQQNGTLVSATNIYDATNNPTGNLLGTAGQCIGTTGTKAGSPTPTGELPDGWVESAGGGSFASIDYSSPQGASPVARADGFPGHWFRTQYNTATGDSDRSLKCEKTITHVAGRKYRLLGTLRISGATFLKIFQLQLLLVSASGRSVTTSAVYKLGSTPIGVSAVIADTGALYLASDPVSPPDDFTGVIRVTTWCIVGNGGSATIDLADVVVDPVF